MSQLSTRSLLAQSCHITIIGLSGNESELEWYIVVQKGHELARPVLTLPQTHAEKIRHASHNIKHHRAAVLVEKHGYEVSTKILHLQSLHIIESESGQKKIIISVTNLKHRLDINEHISYILHHDGLAIMNKLHLLMKGRRNSLSSVDPWSAQKQVKGCRNPQNLKNGDKSGQIDQ